jgi:hypothetical protein
MGFKEYYIREQVKWQTHIDEIVFHYSNNRYLPLSHKIFKELFGAKKIKTFHVTDKDGFDKLKKITNKKNISISTMTTIDHFKTGVHRKGIIVKVEGDLLLHDKEDLDSVPENNGRRWITTNILSRIANDPNLEKTLNGEIDNIPQKLIPYLQTKIILKDTILMDIYQELKSNNEDMDFLELFELLVKYNNPKLKKMKTTYIKMYINEVENILKEYRNVFINATNDEIQTYKYEWNEIIISNIEIVKVAISDTTISLSKDDHKKFDIYNYETQYKDFIT